MHGQQNIKKNILYDSSSVDKRNELLIFQDPVSNRDSIIPVAR